MSRSALVKLPFNLDHLKPPKNVWIYSKGQDRIGYPRGFGFEMRASSKWTIYGKKRNYKNKFYAREVLKMSLALHKLLAVI